jgi:hypothetical protein
MAISNAAITTGGDDIFTCPGTLGTDVQEHAVTCLIFCNISGSAANLTVTATPQGGSARALIQTLPIPATETFTFDTEKLVLSTGDKITATASANSAIVATVSSMRVS